MHKAQLNKPFIYNLVQIRFWKSMNIFQKNISRTCETFVNEVS